VAEESHLDIDPRMTASIPWIMRNGVGIQIMETLAVGAFLTAFAVQLGASNFTIGLLAAVPHLSQLAQIPALSLNPNPPRLIHYGDLGTDSAPTGRTRSTTNAGCENVV